MNRLRNDECICYELEPGLRYASITLLKVDFQIWSLAHHCCVDHFSDLEAVNSTESKVRKSLFNNAIHRMLN
jgi:hypothetical protein